MFNLFARFSITFPSVEGLISKISVFGLQKIKFANPAPWSPIIFSALKKVFTCSLNDISANLIAL